MHYVCPGTCNTVSEDSTSVCTDNECVNYGNNLEECDCTDQKHTPVLLSGLDGVLDDDDDLPEDELEEDADDEDDDAVVAPKISKSALDDIEEQYIAEEIQRTKGSYSDELLDPDDESNDDEEGFDSVYTDNYDD